MNRTVMPADHSPPETSAPPEGALPVAKAGSLPPGMRDRRARLMRFIGTYGTIIVLAAMLVIFSILQPGTFATIGNFRNIINDMAIGTIVAAVTYTRVFQRLLADHMPFGVALIELAQGVRLQVHMANPAQATPGDRARIVFRPLHTDGTPVPVILEPAG